MQNGCQLRIEELTPRALVMIGCLATLAPAFAQDDLRIAPARLSLTVRNEPPDELCRRFDPSDASQLATVSLHRTFHGGFDAHPLSTGKWVPHYAGGAAVPDARERCSRPVLPVRRLASIICAACARSRERRRRHSPAARGATWPIICGRQ